MNEGFATYGEALWQEHVGGPEALQQYMLAIEEFGPGTIYVPELTSFDRIFDVNLSYRKASWVLHMLRHIAGSDSTFFRIYRTYGEKYKYSTATTADFEAVAEQVTGKDLHAFFQEWIHGEDFPSYTYDWSASPSAGGWDLSVRLRQLQTNQIFTMPVDIAVTTPAGVQTEVAQNSTADSTYVWHLTSQPTDVKIDPGHWILRRLFEPIPETTFEKPLLLVNSMRWSPYTWAQIQAAYQARAFTGDFAFDFWDVEDPPDGGYPSNLPPPMGHGIVPASVLGHYRQVVWVGQSDPSYWVASPMYRYLEAGGNVLLYAGDPGFLIDPPYLGYLGIQVADSIDVTTGVAEYPGLTNMPIQGDPQKLSEFRLLPGSNGTLLFGSQPGAQTGFGVFRQPPGSARDDSHPGVFAFILGTPFDWDPNALRANSEVLLSRVLPPQIEPTAQILFDAPRPNPFGDRVSLRFYLPAAGTARLTVWDTAGRRVRVLRNTLSPAGWNGEVWDGLDDQGQRVASGIYFTRLEVNGTGLNRRIVRIQ